MFTQIDSCRVALVHAARARRGCLLAVAHLDPWLAVLNLPSQVSCSALVCAGVSSVCRSWACFRKRV